jgi:hypothetical protein
MLDIGCWMKNPSTTKAISLYVKHRASSIQYQALNPNKFLDRPRKGMEYG